MWIDSHCHLNHGKIKDAGTPAELRARAHLAGISGMLTVCCNIAEEYDELRGIAAQFDDVWCTVGTHPHDAAVESEMALSAADIAEKASADPNIIGIGETGLDYYYNNSPKAEQIASFEKHVEACLLTDLPIIIHSRDAEEDTARILRDSGKGKLRGLMHCFSSGPQLARDALDIGFYISFSGIVTFPKAEELREIVKSMPLDRILVETDAPYLAPVPHRGQTNEPAYVAKTGVFLAELKGISPEEMAEIMTENFFRLFNTAK